MNRNDLFRLMNITNRMDGLYYRLSQNRNVSENAVALLYALSDGKPHSQKQIAEEWLIPRTTLNSVVKNWVEKGYMTFSGHRGKEKELSLTETGTAFAEQVLAPMFRAEQIAMAQTTETDFIDGLEKFEQALEAAAASEEAKQKGTDSPHETTR